MFNNATIRSTFNQFNGNSFRVLVSFGMYSSLNTVYYYVMDWGASKVYILNDEWKFTSSKSFSHPAYIISIGNSLYMTGRDNVWKVDKDLNIFINYNPGGDPYYGGISYNPSNVLIYVASDNLKEIQVFNLDLTLIRRFSTSPHKPFPIQFPISSNQFYVGTDTGIVLVYQNEKIINQFNGCYGNSVWLLSISLDPNGYMATSCWDLNKLYLFSQNGSFTGKSITTPYRPLYIGFDSKGRFIQISENQINIYN